MNYIIHGSNRRLARNLGKAFKLVTGERWGRVNVRDPLPESRPADWNRDIFLAFPDSRCVVNQPEDYSCMEALFHGNKRDQWQYLKTYFKCPEVKDPPYVVRPLRHERGEGFEIVNDVTGLNPATHYWRSLWRRNSEYRVIYIFGKKVLTLLKRVPEGTDQNIPWSVGVSSFVTVHDPDKDRLRHTNFDEHASKFLQKHPFHLIAFDLLFRAGKYRLVEVNFNPGITIEANFEALVAELLSR